jgi:putative membrane protein
MPEIASPPASTLTPAKTARQRTDTFTSIWMIIAVAMALVTLVVKNRMPQPLWTMIHLVTLGVLSNGIFQWSWFFARSLARLSADDPRARRHNTIRILIFNACFLLLFVSMWLGWMVGTMIAATGIAAVAAWHGAEMLSVLRERLASRFVIVVRYYVCSASFFVLAALLASFVSATMFSPSIPEALVAMRDRLTLAHALSGVAGWVGLTIGGTAITLGPTILRTRMSPDAVRGGVRVLLPWCLSLLLAIAGALLGVMPLVGAGILAVGTCAIVGIVYPYAKVLRNKGPREYSAWSFLLGLLWISVGVCALGVASLFVSTPSQLRVLTLMWLPIIGIAGFAQLFQGALSYLMPVVIGGGPSVVRIGIAIIDWQYSLRLGLRNGALILELFLFFTSDSPSVHVLRMAGWLLVIATFVIDVVIYAKTGITQAQARRARSETLSESRQVQ